MPDARDLLSRLADEVGDVEPPVDLLLRGRRRHRRRVLGATGGAALAVVAVVAAALLVPVHPRPAVTAARVPREATAAALAAGSWTVGPASPLGARAGATLTWTGREVLEVGGSTAAETRHGAAYDPVRATWRALPEAPAEIGSGRGTAQVWVGGSLFVLAGAGDDRPLPTPAIPALSRAVLYSPADDRWSVTSPSPFGPVLDPVVVAVGSRVLVVAAMPEGGLAAAWYDPATDAWTRTDPPVVAGHRAQVLSAVSTPAGVLVWSMWSGPAPTPGPPRAETVPTPASGVDVLRLTDTWSLVTGAWSQTGTVGQPQLTGSGVVLPRARLWCPPCIGGIPRPAPFRVVDPVTLAVRDLPRGPLDGADPTGTWTGGALIALNPYTQSTLGGTAVEPGDLGILDLAAGVWSRAARAPLGLANAERVWAGTRLVALAGDGRALTFRAAP